MATRQGISSPYESKPRQNPLGYGLGIAYLLLLVCGAGLSTFAGFASVIYIDGLSKVPGADLITWIWLAILLITTAGGVGLAWLAVTGLASLIRRDDLH